MATKTIEIKHIDSHSLSMILALFGLFSGLVKGLFLLLAAGAVSPVLAGMPFLPPGLAQEIPAYGFVGMLVLIIVGTISGYILGWVVAWLYNYFATLVGGVKFDSN